MKQRRFSWRRFSAIVKKEVIQVLRDPVSLRLAIIMPVFMMLLFGYALSTEVDHITTAVYDQGRNEDSRALVERFTASGYFKISYYSDSEKEVKDLIQAGRVKAGLIILPGYSPGADALSSQALLIIDGSDPTTARTALSSGLLLAQAEARDAFEQKQEKSGVYYAINLEPMVAHVWYNPDLKNTNFTIPGLVGLITQSITVMLTAFSLVREREKGTIEQLIVTPIRPAELILGKLIPYVVIGYAGFLFALFLCIEWFGIIPAGNIALLIGLGLIFVICSLMIGMLISTFAKSQAMAMMLLMLVILPSVLLSGFIFPREAMPDIVKAVGYILPLTYFLNIIRGVVLKGVGMEFLWLDVVLLSALTVVLALAAIFRFRKTLD